MFVGVLLATAVLAVTADVEQLEVKLDGLGKIRGKAGVARNKDTFYQFLGVPYAEPPTGERRYLKNIFKMLS